MLSAEEEDCDCGLPDLSALESPVREQAISDFMETTKRLADEQRDESGALSEQLFFDILHEAERLVGIHVSCKNIATFVGQPSNSMSLSMSMNEQQHSVALSQSFMQSEAPRILPDSNGCFSLAVAQQNESDQPQEPFLEEQPEPLSKEQFDSLLQEKPSESDSDSILFAQQNPDASTASSNNADNFLALGNEQPLLDLSEPNLFETAPDSLWNSQTPARSAPQTPATAASRSSAQISMLPTPMRKNVSPIAPESILPRSFISASESPLTAIPVSTNRPSLASAQRKAAESFRRRSSAADQHLENDIPQQSPNANLSKTNPPSRLTSPGIATIPNRTPGSVKSPYSAFSPSAGKSPMFLLGESQAPSIASTTPRTIVSEQSDVAERPPFVMDDEFVVQSNHRHSLTRDEIVSLGRASVHEDDFSVSRFAAALSPTIRHSSSSTNTNADHDDKKSPFSRHSNLSDREGGVALMLPSQVSPRRLQRQLEEKERQLTASEERGAELEFAVRQKDDTISRLRRELADANTAHDLAADATTQSDMNLQKAEIRIKSLEQQIRTHTATESDLESKIRLHDAEMERAEHRIKQQSTEIDMLRKSNADLTRQHESTLQSIVEFQQTFARQQSEILSSQQTRRALEERIEELSAELEQARAVQMPPMLASPPAATASLLSSRSRSLMSPRTESTLAAEIVDHITPVGRASVGVQTENSSSLDASSSLTTSQLDDEIKVFIAERLDMLEDEIQRVLPQQAIYRREVSELQSKVSENRRLLGLRSMISTEIESGIKSLRKDLIHVEQSGKNLEKKLDHERQHVRAIVSKKPAQQSNMSPSQIPLKSQSMQSEVAYPQTPARISSPSALPLSAFKTPSMVGSRGIPARTPVPLHVSRAVHVAVQVNPPVRDSATDAFPIPSSKYDTEKTTEKQHPHTGNSFTLFLVTLAVVSVTAYVATQATSTLYLECVAPTMPVMTDASIHTPQSSSIEYWMRSVLVAMDEATMNSTTKNGSVLSIGVWYSVVCAVVRQIVMGVYGVDRGTAFEQVIV